MDNLEKFIIQNREDFDTAVPSLKAWAAIDRKLEQKQQAGKRVRMWKVLRIAASVAILLFVGGVGGYYLSGGANAEEIQHTVRLASVYI